MALDRENGAKQLLHFTPKQPFMSLRPCNSVKSSLAAASALLVEGGGGGGRGEGEGMDEAAHCVSIDYGRRKRVYRPLDCAAFTCTCEAMIFPSYTPCQSPLQRAPQRRTQNESSVAEMDGRRCLSLRCSHSAAAIVRRSLHQYYVDVPPRSSEVCEPSGGDLDLHVTRSRSAINDLSDLMFLPPAPLCRNTFGE